MLSLEENWKQIEEATNYAISDLGRVKNTKSGMILNPSGGKDSYKQVSLKLIGDGTFKKRYVHRLVAQYFVENSDPEHKKEVNHKNSDKSDNRAVNLEWATTSENQKHKYSVGGCNRTSNRRIGQFDLETGELIKIYDSIISAVKAVNLKSRSGLDNVLRGTAHSAGGYFWMYLDQEIVQ